MTINEKTAAFIATHGEWTAMAITLPDGSHTRTPAPDRRLRRLIQVARDTVKKPISECRVLDLACLEGHYAIEFAMHGAAALGIEGREVSVAKCNYAKNSLGLKNVEFVVDDVRNLSVEKYGKFDIVICSGILYHLTLKDGVAFLKSISDVCTGIILLDTFVSLLGREKTSSDGRLFSGHYYPEHADDSKWTHSETLWGSLDNKASFWFTEATLLNLMMDIGFTSIVDVLVPTKPDEKVDRKTYLAIKGTRAEILSSHATETENWPHLKEGPNNDFDSSQIERGIVHRTAKRILPPFIKDAIKPALRAVKILPPDETPEFMKKGRQRHQ